MVILKIYADVALKAQNNIRKTAETLLNIKRPSTTTFVKNQVTNQQVNFNQDALNNSENNLKSTNELLTKSSQEPIKNEKVDTGRKEEASKVNS